jgi:hypothetical protein
MVTRAIPLSVHAGLETLAAPAVMAAPFVLGFGAAATVACIAIGAVLLGLALQVPGPQRVVPLAAHASFDYALAAFAAIAGVMLGLATGSWVATVFLVGMGAAHVLLTASTRFSAPRGSY